MLEINRLEKSVQDSFNRAVEKPRRTLARFPTLFLLLVTAGVVMVLFGFERWFDQISLFHNRPYLMILIGLGVLIFTGRLYKKLDR